MCTYQLWKKEQKWLNSALSTAELPPKKERWNVKGRANLSLPSCVLDRRLSRGRREKRPNIWPFGVCWFMGDINSQVATSIANWGHNPHQNTRYHDPHQKGLFPIFLEVGWKVLRGSSIWAGIWRMRRKPAVSRCSWQDTWEWVPH